MNDSAKIWLSKSLFYVKNTLNFSVFLSFIKNNKLGAKVLLLYQCNIFFWEMFIVVQKSCFLDPPSNEFHNQTDSSLLLLIFNHIDIIFSWISVLSLVSLSTTAALWQESRNCLTYCADHINCCEDKTVSYHFQKFY